MIVIDINSLGFAATAANGELRANGVLTGGVFGIIRSLRTLRQEFPGRMIGLWDGRAWRYESFPAYKGNRGINPKLVKLKNQWKAQRPMVARALKHMGVDQLIASNMEADDLAARFVRSARDKPITLITGDKDWLQLVSPTVTWVDPIRDRRCTPRNFEELSGCATAWQFIQQKALAGDQGDNIPPAGGVGPGAAKWIFENMGSVDALLNESISGDSKAWPKKIRDFADDPVKRDNYHRNLKLVWLCHPGVPDAVNPVLTKGAINPAAFSDLTEELNFHSILRDPAAWLMPFSREHDLINERVAA